MTAALAALAAFLAMILKGYLVLCAWLGVGLQAALAMAWTLDRAEAAERRRRALDRGPWGYRDPPGSR